MLWAVNRNRPARPAVWRSRVTVKADAATRLFSLSCRTLCWAVLDSGIDATHPAFARRDGDAALTEAGARPAAGSRVRASYDFTGLRALLAEAGEQPDGAPGDDFNARLLSGRPVDWDLLLPRLEVKKDDYRRAHARARHARRRDPGRRLAPGGRAGARRPRRAGRLPRHGALRPARVRRERRRRRVRDPRRAAVRALDELQRLRADDPRRQPLALARPRGRRLRVRAHAGLRRVRAAARQRHGRRRGRGQRGPGVLLDEPRAPPRATARSRSPTPATPTA